MKSTFIHWYFKQGTFSVNIKENFFQMGEITPKEGNFVAETIITDVFFWL